MNSRRTIAINLENNGDHARNGNKAGGTTILNGDDNDPTEEPKRTMWANGIVGFRKVGAHRLVLLKSDLILRSVKTRDAAMETSIYGGELFCV